MFPHTDMTFILLFDSFILTLTENQDCWELSKRTSTALVFDCKSYDAGEE